MNSYIVTVTLFICLLVFSIQSVAEENSNSYSPSKVVYDFSSSEPAVLKNILDRISMLQNVYNNNSFEASIVVVIHEAAIPLFAKKDTSRLTGKYVDLLLRARSLTLGEVIEFKVCEASAKMQGITAEDLPEFTSMVPMADAEMVKLQQAGYAYLR